MKSTVEVKRESLDKLLDEKKIAQVAAAKAEAHLENADQILKAIVEEHGELPPGTGPPRRRLTIQNRTLEAVSFVQGIRYEPTDTGYALTTRR